MKISEKIAIAKETNWVSEGLTEAEVKTSVELARISAKIERCRLELGMTQKEFADFMGVTQGMVSKWESREYNFTIRSLNDICHKLDLFLSMNIEKPCSKNDYMISNYKALNNIMDRYIPTMRGKIIEGMKSDERLINAHRRIVEGFVEGNYLKGRQGLNLHFRYIKEYKDYEEVHKNGIE